MILITTPTGAIGSQVLDELLDPGTEKLRVIVRDRSRLPDSTRDRVDVIAGSHRDPEVIDRAFPGVDAVLWVVPPDVRAISMEDAYAGFTSAAAAAFIRHGITHVVGVSALGRGTPVAAGAGLVTATLAVDDLIAGTGVAYRALANPGFMDNLLRQLDSIRHGTFSFTVAPDRTMPWVATKDIAAAAAHLLRDRSWTGTGNVPVLGPEDLSPNDMARTMSEVLGRTVRYQQQSLDELAATMTGQGAGRPFVQGMLDMIRAKEAGLDGGVERTPQTASPTSFRQWCEEVLRPALLAG